MHSDSTAVVSPPWVGVATAWADQLAVRHELIAQAWQTDVEADPGLDSDHALSRARFLRHLPHVLLELESGLRGEGNIPFREPPSDDSSTAECDLREVILEWGHLHSCLLGELAAFCGDLPPLHSGAALALQVALARAIHLATAESAERCSRQNAVRARSQLETELAALAETIRRRAATLRVSGHDLRGQLTVIMSATDFINDPTIDGALRTESSSILKRGVQTLRDMLLGLLDEFKLQAENEKRP